MKRKKPDNSLSGFTLLEVILGLTFTTLLVVVVFTSWSRVRDLHARALDAAGAEKDMYILHRSLMRSISNMSTITRFNNRQQRPLFSGSATDVLFISHQPLLDPHRSPHFVRLRLEADQLIYQELLVTGSDRWEDPGWNEIPRDVLLEDVKDIKFIYTLWNKKTNRYETRSQVDTFRGDELPLRVTLELTTAAGSRTFMFQRKLSEPNDQIPSFLLR